MVEDMSTKEKAIIYYLIAHGNRSNIDDMADDLNVTKLDLYPLIDRLEEKERIHRKKDMVVFVDEYYKDTYKHKSWYPNDD